MTSFLTVTFFAFVLVLWFTYNDGAGKANLAEQPQAQQPGQAGQTKEPLEPSDGPEGQPQPEQNGGGGESDGTAGPDDGEASGQPSGSDDGGGEGGEPPEGEPSEAVSGEGGAGRIELAFVGDVIFAGNVAAALANHGFDYPYRHVRHWLSEADFTIANLETPITDRGEAAEKTYAYRSSPEALPAFRDAGIDLVNLANNHILDYGEVGLLDTMDHLDAHSIHWFGVGRHAAEAFSPAIVEKDGVKIAFLGFSRVVPDESWKVGLERPGVADSYALEAPLAAIGRAREQADLVVVIAHWGVERQAEAEPYQREFAKRYIDAGADLVIGGHPHVVQGFEQYKGKWIAYSLGNFIFTMNENPTTWESMIVQASCLPGDSCDLQIVPILTKLANPQPMNEEDGRKLFARLTDISYDAEVGPDGAVRLKR